MDDEILETKPLSRQRRDARFSSFTSVQRKSAHIPVLLHEVIEFLDLKPGKFVVDGTVNGGGHGAEILKRIQPGGTLLGIDWDGSLIEKLKKVFQSGKNVFLVHENYANLPDILKKQRLPKADGLLLDLGFSSEQIERSGRGFSFLKDEPLLMTYSDGEKPVKDILRNLSEKELTDILFRYGEEKFAKRIARAIQTEEEKKPIETTADLERVIRDVVPVNYERGRINPSTRTFQALRIYANNELGNLENVLKNLAHIVKPGGRAVIISFHSLEDRLVKNCFREMERNNQAILLTKKPVTAFEEEARENPRSRSAKLRAIQMA